MSDSRATTQQGATHGAGIRPPAAALLIARTLEQAGHETWCVGGAVRDALLGRPQLDWDFATSATPQQVRRLFARTVPVGIEHGTIGVLDAAGHMHEVTTFRRDVQTDGRHAVVEFGASLDEDLARRDFTINAIAYSPARDELRDPFDGRGDLARRVLRAVGVAADRMREDRLRALRAIRFASRFDFDIEPATWTAIAESAPYLRQLSPERVRQELEKSMEQIERPSIALERWRASGALAALIPALASQPAVNFATTDWLARAGSSARPQRRATRIAALFFGIAGRDTERALKSLRFPNADAAWIGALAARWDALGAEMHSRFVDGRVDDATLRRWAAAAGRTRLAPLLRVASARWAAERDAGVAAPTAAAVRSVYRRALRIAYRDPIELGDLAVDGEDLRLAGIPAGPALGKILHALLADVVEDPARNRRDWLLERALAAAAPGGTAPPTAPHSDL